MVNGLPLIDVLVLDEADRMVADGHFKEMDKILNHIYTKRVLMKRAALASNKKQKTDEEDDSKNKLIREAILREQDATKSGKGFKVTNNLLVKEGEKPVNLSKVVDLDEEALNDEEIERLTGKNGLVLDMDDDE